MADLDAIRKLAEEALEQDKKATKGPWFWNVNLKAKHIYLESHGRGHGFEYVMDFARWGMNGATPRFRTHEDLLENAESWATTVIGREHHAQWHRTISHPDAEFIASARTREPKLARALLKVIPFVGHSQDCEDAAKFRNSGEPVCICDLDAALREIEA